MIDVPSNSHMFLCRLRPVHGIALAAITLIATGCAQFSSAAASQTDMSPFALLMKWAPFILSGFLLNLLMSALAMIIATGAGLGLALLRMSEMALFRMPAAFLIGLCRNTPWIVILFAVTLLLPYQLKIAGLELPVPAWLKATLGFSIPVAANVADIIRGAVGSVPRGQWEASEGLAFGRWQTIWWIILPQCIKRMLPPWMNWYAILALATPIASIMGVREAVGSTQQALDAAGAQTVLLVPFYAFVLTIFFLYIYPIGRIALRLESRYAVKL